MEKDSYSDDDIRNYLESGGTKLDAYFLEESPYATTICYRNEDGRVFNSIIEQPDVHDAAIKFLRKQGVPIEKLEDPRRA